VLVVKYYDAMMHCVRNCVANRGLKILNDFRSVFLKRYLRSLGQCHGVDLCGSLIGLRQTCSIGRHTITRSTALLSDAHCLQISCCTVHSDAVTDTESADPASTEQSADSDCQDSEGSNLHTPVLAKEVVNLIAPVKGQVGMFS